MKKPSSEANSSSSLQVQKSDKEDVATMFKRTEVIGRGKFGVVYKGHHVRTKQVYAIKVLNLDSDEDEVEDVQREVQFLASMKQTPNITHYYGSYLKNTKLWIIIEYCAGGSLRTLLRPGKIDEKYIGIIMREVLIALKHIHRDNVIHRDIKAANVLITNEGHVKLCDFGVAAQLNQSSLKRQTMAGTPYWMAPEVIMEGVYYDTKVDIWSLGITTFEIATGNPPYCDVEALRAMQLITKSKPPRLEGRHYSSMLKDFIALCLDEDPKERLSADDLLKSKFIKHYKTISTTILKELITRYLLFRDKRSSNAGLASMTELDQSVIDEAHGKPNDGAAGNSSNPSDLQVEMRWDFDSLSSSDYIINNDINLEEIPEESAVGWSSPFDQVNFAYPDEERNYFQTASNTGGLVYQGTTIGKNMGGNSTVNALHSSDNSTAQPGKALKNGHTGVDESHKASTTNNNSAKKTETKAPKKLMELFEDNGDEADGASNELSRINKNIPNDLSRKPHSALVNNNVYHSHSTPALPVIQTKFNKPSISIPSASAAPTPIEIEIPEELPTSTTTPAALPGSIPSSSLDPVVQPQAMPAAPHLKPRSSTFSSYKPPPSSIATRAATGKLFDDASRRDGSNNTENGLDNVLLKRPLRTPSPSKVLLSHVTSPAKKPGASPAGLTSGVPSAMKAVGINHENKDVLLQPLNNNSTASASSGSTSSTATGRDISRVNRDFKLNNPNLKLHMPLPLPTPMAATKLLDSTDLQPVGAPTSGDNINQFGINTSAISNVPVSMTPISEKHMDFGTGRIRRTQSLANRKASQSADPVLPSMNGASNSNSTNNNNNNTNNNNNNGSNNNNNSIHNGSLSNTGTPSNSDPQLIPPPPYFLSLDLFLDMSMEVSGYSFLDRKPQMLEKLESLLKMYEDGLPVLEGALKKQLISVDADYEDKVR